MRLLIIGKYSRITQFFKDHLNQKFKLSIKNYNDVIKKKSNYFKRFDYIINCASNKRYVNYKYNSFYDYDYQIVKKIVNFKTSYIFLSTRKVYKPSNNCLENDKLKPRCNYSKNKLITEKKLRELIVNKLLILRISNVIGINKVSSKRKLHKTFIDVFFDNIRKNIIIDNGRKYKDFITSQKLVQIVSKLITLNSVGTFNLSIGKKIYLNDIIQWLNFYNMRKCKTIKIKNFNFNKDSFYLNNNRIKKITKINPKIKSLKNECKKISKNYFIGK